MYCVTVLQRTAHQPSSLSVRHRRKVEWRPCRISERHSNRLGPVVAPDPVCTDVLNCLFGPVVSEAPAETIIVTGALILVVTAVLLVL